jgi:LPS export ABC transporter protein LptC
MDPLPEKAIRNHYIIKFTKSVAILFGMAMLFSCQPDLKTIESLTRVDEGPVESTRNIEIIYSEGAHIRMTMRAPQMDRYEGETQHFEMPLGLEVEFFDTLMNITSRMSANYAISHDENKLVEARNDVVVVNQLGERLNTEHLVWDQEKAIIFSDKFVKITTEDEILYGDGFESDERFDQWTILGPRGTFTIDTDGGPGSEVGAEPGSEPESESPRERLPEPDRRSEPQQEPLPDPAQRSEPQPQPAPQSETQPRSEPGMQPDRRPDTLTAPDRRSEPQPQPAPRSVAPQRPDTVPRIQQPTPNNQQPIANTQ